MKTLLIILGTLLVDYIVGTLRKRHEKNQPATLQLTFAELKYLIQLAKDDKEGKAIEHPHFNFLVTLIPKLESHLMQLTSNLKKQ